MVQNMSLFVCPNCNHESHIFGNDGAVKKAEEMNIPLLGQVPLHGDICELSDSGKPIVVSKPDSPFSDHYRSIASSILQKLQLA